MPHFLISGIADLVTGVGAVIEEHGGTYVGVDDIDDVVARLHTLGAELVGEVEQYEDSYRLCYIRGPEGIIVALAEEPR